MTNEKCYIQTDDSLAHNSFILSTFSSVCGQNTETALEFQNKSQTNILLTTTTMVANELTTARVNSIFIIRAANSHNLSRAHPYSSQSVNI